VIEDASTLTLPRTAGEGNGEVQVSIGSACVDDLQSFLLQDAQRTPRSQRIYTRRHWLHASLSLGLLAVVGLCISGAALASNVAQPKLASIPAGRFESVLPASEETKQVAVSAFGLDVTPVTNAQFARFVQTNPEWQRDRVARVFADEQYLQHWRSNTQPAADSSNQPVVHVSWFAASAYCESRGARLATWHEWEYVAAASDSRRDARDDPQWRQQILAWYSRSGRGELPHVGRSPANIYGLRDIHGMVWEWIEDLPSMLVANDSREQGDPNEMKFCGAGAITMEQKENYAMLMRIAMLSSMKASYASATMGFRCATDGGSTP
jgi:sulfatase modifying factor 1